MSQTIIEKVIETAARNLRSAGCQFAILKPDGEVLGDLQLAPKKTGIKRHRMNNFIVTGYHERVDAMQPGDVQVFEVGDFDAEQYRGAISARASTVFGKGNSTSTIEGKEIQLLRLA